MRLGGAGGETVRLGTGTDRVGGGTGLVGDGVGRTGGSGEGRAGVAEGAGGVATASRLGTDGGLPKVATLAALLCPAGFNLGIPPAKSPPSCGGPPVDGTDA